MAEFLYLISSCSLEHRPPVHPKLLSVQYPPMVVRFEELVQSIDPIFASISKLVPASYACTLLAVLITWNRCQLPVEYCDELELTVAFTKIVKVSGLPLSNHNPTPDKPCEEAAWFCIPPNCSLEPEFSLLVQN